jgi:hypothetical protein
MVSSPQQEEFIITAERRDIARVMSWIGMAMILFFLVATLSPAWPIQLLQPRWIDQRSGSLVSSGAFALLAALLIAAAPLVDPNADQLSRRATLVRRLASWVAIGYLLLIPLQTTAGVQLLREREQKQSELLGRAQQSVAAMQRATTEAELRQAYEQIPGNKPRLGPRFTQPLEVVRDRLIDALQPRIKRLESEFARQQSSRWQRFFGLLARNALGQLSMFIGFAALGRQSPAHPTLLSSLRHLDLPNPLGLLSPLKGSRRERIGSPRIPPEWLEKESETRS